MTKGKMKFKRIIVVVPIMMLISIVGIILLTRKENLYENKQLEVEKKDFAEGEILPIDTSDWSLEKVDIVYDTEGIAVPIPKEYVASQADGEHTVNTGFVIYEGEGEVTTENAWEESKTRNQWVWVPIRDVSRIYEENNGVKKAKLYDYSSSGTVRTSITNGNYEPGITNARYSSDEYNFDRYGLQGMTKEKLYQKLQVEYNETIKSIEKYGGFYIGRYETGDISKEVPVVKRMNTDIGSQTWCEMYDKMEYLVNGINVKSNMIWGSLWDETLQWLIESGSKSYEEIAKDSSEWGNYNNSTFEYTNTSGGISTKNKDSNTIIPTGSTERNKGNNIYDMAGNVFDWTLEASDTWGHCFRGGIFSGSGSLKPSTDRNIGNPNISMNYSGFRAYFYIR